MKRLPAAAAAFAALTVTHGFAQTACRGTVLTGIVRDTTQALVPGATLMLDGSQQAVSGSDGRFRFPCVSEGKHSLSATEEGFRKVDMTVNTPRTADLSVVMQVGLVETQVQVNAASEEALAVSANASGATQTLAGTQLQALADDPDDLLRQLQQAAAAGGADMSNVTIAVDGFQGSSGLPPKSSIAYIKVNPDLYAAEFQEPPFDGARVEVYTKPGQKAYHGALFATNSSPWMNARDPFSTSRASLGKQRYGFELSGPVRKTGSDFFLTLEHRSIDNFAVVNAVTLDPSGNPVNTIANVATPQRLWIGQAKLNWQLGPKNTFIASYNANVNHLTNLGVGGAALPQAGYDSERYEHIFRMSDIMTISPKLMHEARLSFRWDGETDMPISTAPQVQVAGAFTGGGATIGPQKQRELNIEADDDVIWTPKNHNIKIGDFFFVNDERQTLTRNFNGTYTFGGGTAPVLDSNGNPIPGQTETITGVEQYRRALLGLPGGTPTAFSNVAGNPQVNFAQYTNTVFFQDDWNAGHNLHIAYGVRYYIQTSPTFLNSAAPRLGILWSPDKKNRWTLHAHAGLFNGRLGTGTEAELLRMDGVERVTSTIYNPTYNNPLGSGTPIHSMRTVAPKLTNLTWTLQNVGGTRALPKGWNLSLDYYIGRFWNYARTNNINSPLNDDPLGPRPGAPNLNVLQLQNSGQGKASGFFGSVGQHAWKRLQMQVGVSKIDVMDDADNNPFFTPQSSTSNAGELAHRTNQHVWNVFGNGTLNLPEKVQLSGALQAASGNHYNVTTGFDNNGDGNFNDRPQYAAAGTPGAIQTPFGLLAASGGTGVFPRNAGTMPWQFYLDMNVQRAFLLTRNNKAEHKQTLTVNLRSSNLLNHMNVTQVGGVLGSPLFGRPYAADNGRRVEAGLRYSF